MANGKNDWRTDPVVDQMRREFRDEALKMRAELRDEFQRKLVEQMAEHARSSTETHPALPPPRPSRAQAPR